MAYFRPLHYPVESEVPVSPPPVSSPDDVIQIVELKKRYGRKMVVCGLTFSVPPRTLFGFLGPNGAGKSTTLYMLLGLVRPTGGTVRIFGQSVHAREVKQRVGSMIETPAFYGYLSGRKNLELLGRLTRTAERRHIDEALDIVGLLSRGDDKVSTYSDGMRQRLGVAQALLHKPDLLILDEPTNGLDPEGNRDLWLLLRRLVAERGLTALVSSHLLSEVEEYCDRVCVIDQGRQVACDTVENLLRYESPLLDVTFPDETVRALALRCFARHDWIRVVAGEMGAAGPRTVRVELRRDPVELSRLLRQSVLDVEAIVPVRRTLKEFFLSLTSKGEGNWGRKSL
ncbi:MAG: ABC transporter ATP-binding protein [Candidatus Sumerlaeia bacterium]|nr:ABC transporter ATP-binding protein [Candidatus Sumerlaeia bacterium]